MDNIIKQINVDLDKINDIFPIVTAKQYDTVRQIDITLIQNSTTYTIAPTATARIYLKKGDNTVSYINCTITDNVVSCLLTNQSLAVAGELEAEIELIDGTDTLSSPIFLLKILPSNIDDAAIESTNEFTALEDALAIVSGIDNKLDKTGDSKDCTTTFTEASTEEDINSTETHATIFGKIKKSISTFRTAIGTLANLTTTVKTDLVSAINEIVSSITPVAGTLTPESGFTFSGLKYSKQLNRVLLSGYFTNSSAMDAGTYVKVATGDFLPTSLSFFVINNMNGQAGIGYVSTDGSVMVRYYSQVQIGASNVFDIIYQV